jgi:antitoxin MazE
MKARVQRWGNSLAVRLPKAVVESLKLDEGSVIGMEEREGCIILKPVHDYQLDELLDGVRPEQMHGEVSTGASRGKESW